MRATTASVPKLEAGSVAALELTEQQPFTQLDGSPLGTRGVELWRSDDRTIEVGVWECDAGCFHAKFENFGESITIVSGDLACTADADGTMTTLRPGDTMVFPRGWTGEWRMSAPLRKIYTTWTAE